MNKRNLCLAPLLFLLNYPLFAATKTIHFGTEAAYPPFEYVDASGAITGFDIAIASAVCKQIQANCTFSNQSFNSLLPSLQLGKFDALIAAMGITPERKKQVIFTDTYYQPSASFIAPIAAHLSLTTLQSKQIGVQTGSVFERYLHDKYAAAISAKSYINTQEALLDLSAGRIDVVLIDTPIANTWLEKDNHQNTYQTISKPLVNAEYFGAGYGIALRKDETNLANEFNKALANLKKTGKYAEIKKQYGL